MNSLNTILSKSTFLMFKSGLYFESTLRVERLLIEAAKWIGVFPLESNSLIRLFMWLRTIFLIGQLERGMIVRNHNWNQNQE